MKKSGNALQGVPNRGEFESNAEELGRGGLRRTALGAKHGESAFEGIEKCRIDIRHRRWSQVLLLYQLEGF